MKKKQIPFRWDEEEITKAFDTLMKKYNQSWSPSKNDALKDALTISSFLINAVENLKEQPKGYSLRDRTWNFLRSLDIKKSGHKK